MPLPVTLQVNVTPMEYPYVRRTLPVILRQLVGAVDEVLLTFDLRRSSVSYSQDWEDRRPLMRDLLHDFRKRATNVRILEVDYSPKVNDELAKEFLGRQPVPHADSKGGPFYAYLYGLHSARNDGIFHIDGEMLVGGGGALSWLQQAAELLAARRDVVAISPLPGPPAQDGALKQSAPPVWRRDVANPEAFCSDRFSMRAVYLQRSKFIARLGPLRLRLAAPLHALHGWSAGHPPYRDLDVTVSHAMTRRGLVRLAMHGPAPGLWTLHPKLRSPSLMGVLPDIVRAVEAGRVPDPQRGDGDLNDTLPEWHDLQTPSHRQLVQI
jgi:hypothetical protein